MMNGKFGNVENVNIHIDTQQNVCNFWSAIEKARHVSRPDDVIYHIDVAYTHFSDSSPHVRYKEEEERQGSILDG